MDPSNEPQMARIFQVSQLTAEIQALLERHFGSVWIEAEISNFSAPASGHLYMVLKDAQAQIRGVMFRPQARRLKFLPENGMKVLAQGRIGVYAPRGEYQVILDYIEPLGVGALAMAFEQLKQRLAAEGLFDPARKRSLPFLPQRVALITSPTGAVVRDFLKVIHRRFATLEVLVVPARVQGAEALGDLIRALELVNRELAVDVIVLARGGGSLEDLWTFNEEELARAIRRSRVPVVSAVGHETDLTIADMAADLRAPTPSAAAEILVREKEELRLRLREAKARLKRALQNALEVTGLRLEALERSLGTPERVIEGWWLRLDEAGGRLVRLAGERLAVEGLRLEGAAGSLRRYAPGVQISGQLQQLGFSRKNLSKAIGRLLEQRRFSLQLAQSRLEVLSPLGALQRGYSITFKLPEQTVLTDAQATAEGDRIRVLLGAGSLEARVEKVRAGE